MAEPPVVLQCPKRRGPLGDGITSDGHLCANTGGYCCRKQREPALTGAGPAVRWPHLTTSLWVTKRSIMRGMHITTHAPDVAVVGFRMAPHTAVFEGHEPGGVRMNFVR